MVMIHPTAIVDPHAELAENVQVGPYSMIGPFVKIGSDTVIQSHVVIEGHTEIGRGNTIFNGAQIGQAPIDFTYKGEPTRLIIGDYNTIREFATIQLGTLKENGLTRIGHHNLLMCYVHVSHDTVIGDHNVIANGTQFGGHVKVDHYVVIGALVGVHQFCRLGNHAMIGAGSMVSKDVPPYCMVVGDRASLRGLNIVGLKRRGFSSQDLHDLKMCYRALVVGQELPEGHPNPHVQYFVDFVKKSQRGVIRSNTGISSYHTKSFE